MFKSLLINYSRAYLPGNLILEDDEFEDTIIIQHSYNSYAYAAIAKTLYDFYKSKNINASKNLFLYVRSESVRTGLSFVEISRDIRISSFSYPNGDKCDNIPSYICDKVEEIYNKLQAFE